jgi:hypothetical protein
MTRLNKQDKRYIIDDITEVIEKQLKKHIVKIKKEKESLEKEVSHILFDSLDISYKKKDIKVLKKYDLLSENNFINVFFCVDLKYNKILLGNIIYGKMEQNFNEFYLNNCYVNSKGYLYRHHIETPLILKILLNKNIFIPKNKEWKYIIVNNLLKDKIFLNKILKIAKLQNNINLKFKNILDEYKEKVNSKYTLKSLFKSYPEIKKMISKNTINLIENRSIKSVLSSDFEKTLKLYEKEIK